MLVIDSSRELKNRQKYLDLYVPTDIVCSMLENINRDLRTSHFKQYGGRRRRRGGRWRDDAL